MKTYPRLHISYSLTLQFACFDILSRFKNSSPNDYRGFMGYSIS